MIIDTRRAKYRSYGFWETYIPTLMDGTAANSHPSWGLDPSLISGIGNDLSSLVEQLARAHGLNTGNWLRQIVIYVYIYICLHTPCSKLSQLGAIMFCALLVQRFPILPVWQAQIHDSECAPESTYPVRWLSPITKIEFEVPTDYPLAIYHSYWKFPFVVDLPI